ncbi:MAG: rod shape-determining protein MreC [Planctomycetia bacterium]|nr:rod shape-determining protein MreC [Planctomycetia bacterium]
MALLHRANLNRRKVLIGILGLASAVLLVLPSGVSDKIRVWVAPIFQPLQGIAQGWSRTISTRARQIREGLEGASTESLASQLRTLQNKYVQQQHTRAEKEQQVKDRTRINAELQSDAILGTVPFHTVPAHVISHDLAVRAGLIIDVGSNRGVRQSDIVVDCFLDKGTRAGLARGQPVITGAGLVGVVKTVGPVTSLVQPTTDPQSRIRAMVVRMRGGRFRPGAIAIAQGSADGRRIVLKAVGRGEDVRVGDWIVTAPVADAPLPPYLILGRITRSELKPAALLYEIEAAPRSRLQTLRQVYVLSVSKAKDKTKHSNRIPKPAR